MQAALTIHCQQNGYAKAYSGVSLDSFVKKITFQQLSKIKLKYW